MERHVYWHETVAAGLDDVLAMMRERPAEILGLPNREAADGDDPVHRLHAHFAGSEVSKQVEISHHPVEEFARDTHRMRIEWHAIENEDLFPIMQGELEFTGLSTHPPRCEVAFLGHYKPPLGVIGAIADHFKGHQIAEEAVTGFLRDICQRLAEVIDESATTA